jgi:sulfate/thiosulfate transport system permease protein
MRARFKQFSVLPGFGLTLGYTLFYLSLIVLIPLGALAIKSFSDGPAHFWKVVTDERVIQSLKVSFSTSLIAASINAFFGFIIAWTLIRYDFWGKKILDAIVDMPFALPTAVSGIALVTLYGNNGLIGSLLVKLGIPTPVYTFWGITLALTFIGLPFVVRTLQPAIDELEGEIEEAAASLGASRWKTFWWVLFPSLVPALLTGFALSFARALGEYGSVIFIAGNLPYKTEIAPLLIYIKLDEYDYSGATAIAVVMLLASFAIMLAINLLQWWASYRHR